MKPFKKAAIIGTGLIGGSIALILKKKRLAQQVVGVSRKKRNLDLARRIGAIDSGSRNLQIIEGADLVILAMPPAAILAKSGALAKFIPADALVIDVASTKEIIVEKLEKIFKNFVGAHPLAGSEKRSVSNSQAGIFERSICIFTPSPKTNPAALSRAKALWNKLGAKTMTMTPKNHDQVLAFISHLPHAVAFSLINTVPDRHLKFASGGLRDTTRIAASDAELWSDIFLTNRKNIQKGLEDFIRVLVKLEKAIEKNDRESLVKILKQAKAKRDRLK